MSGTHTPNVPEGAAFARLSRALLGTALALAVLLWLWAATVGRMGEFVVMAPALGAIVAGTVVLRRDRVAASDATRWIATAITVAGVAVFVFCACLVLFVER